MKKNISVSYDFTGRNAKKAGFAKGIITVAASGDRLKNGYYLVYYTSGNELLCGYDELAAIEINNDIVSAEIPDGVMIPQNATGIAVFESKTHFSEQNTAITDAVAVCDIPENKRLKLGKAESVFGAVSDIHMNYEYYGRSAYKKWSRTLEFFAENQISCVIVAGDVTGDASDPIPLEEQYSVYVELVNKSNIDINNVYASLGNHGNTPDDLHLFSKYTKGVDKVHPYEDSPYFYVLKKGSGKTRDNLFVFTWQELRSAGESARVDNFSKEQMDWLSSVLSEFDNNETNIFVIAHSPFLNYGAGDRKNGIYTSLTSFKSEFPQNMRLKSLLQEHKNVIVISGHTHLTLYDGQNYSNLNNEFAHTVHLSSTCWTRAYTKDGKSCPAGTDGRRECGLDYGSEANIISVYPEHIVFTGYNLSTGKIIPAACLIIPK